MRTSKAKQTPVDPGTFHANIQLPDELHLAMKAIQAARRRQDGSTPRLCLLYKEAVEQYVHGKAQQQLLNGGKPLRKIS